MHQGSKKSFWTNWTWKRHYLSVLAVATTILAVNTIATFHQADTLLAAGTWPEPVHSTCEEAEVGSLTLVNRLERRIQCLRSAPVPQPKRFPGYVTNYFDEVTDLGEFLFMAASTIGLAALCSKSSGFLYSRPFGNTSLGDRLPTAPDKALLVQQYTVKSNLYEIYSADFVKKVSSAAKKNDVVTLEGPLQSWRYFPDAREDLRYYFAFSKKTYRTALNKLLTLLRKKGLDHDYMRKAVLVGVDIRWEKMLPILRNVHDRMSDEYLDRVTENLARKHTSAVFFVFSNVPEHAEELFKGRKNFIHVKLGNQETHMALLSMMDHVVLTSGPFGWWAAYLSNAKEIYYFSHIQDGTKLDYPKIREDHYPPDWIAYDML